VEALHRRSPRQARHPRHLTCTAVHGGHRRELRKAIDTVDYTPYFAKYPDNPWARSGAAWKDGRGRRRTVIEKYTGVLAAADVFTESTTFQVLQSIRLDLGYGLVGPPVSKETTMTQDLGRLESGGLARSC